MEKIYKPRLNKTIYIIGLSTNCIRKVKVGYKSKDAFIVKDFENRPIIKIEYKYEEYGLRWFNKLKDVKAYIQSLFDNKLYDIKFIKFNSYYWDIHIWKKYR